MCLNEGGFPAFTKSRVPFTYNGFTMTYLLEIKKEYALPLLEVLRQQEAIELHENLEQLSNQHPVQTGINFDLLKLDTSGFKFNREEANER